MNLVSVTLGALVDRVLDGLQGAPEVGRRTFRATTLDAVTTTFQVDDATLINITDLLEFGDELMFVTAKSNETATATLTVVRGYNATTAQAHAASQAGVINPQWSRKRVARNVRDAFTYLEGQGLPLWTTTTELTPTVDPNNDRLTILELPDETRGVYHVRWGTHEIGNWSYFEDLPIADYPTGKVVAMPRYTISSDESFSVVYRIPYRWSTHPADPVEASAISMIEGTTDVPIAYAIWKLVSAREVSRSQIDRSEESVNSVQANGNALIRIKQTEFFQALDAAKRLNPPPRRIGRSGWRRPSFATGSY